MMSSLKWLGGTAVCAALALGSAVAAKADSRVYNHATGQWESADSMRVQRRMIMQQRRPDARFERTEVGIATKEKPGTIIVDSRSRYLYYVEPGGRATRYGVGVGKEGFGWSGEMRVGRKSEWPDWIPPREMVVRERVKGRILPSRMEGGPQNPLGARALYLYRGGRDSLFRIHGTNQPWTIGRRMSSGCIRMMNEDVADLYARAPRGTKVVVIGPDGRGGGSVYRDLGTSGSGFVAGLFGG